MQTKDPIDWPTDDVAKGIAMKYDLIVRNDKKKLCMWLSDHLERNLLEIRNAVKEPLVPKLRHILKIIEEDKDAEQLAASLSEFDRVLNLAKEASDNK